MKKLLLTILSAFLILISVCGCNNNNNDNPPIEEGKVELVLSKSEKDLLLGEEYELMIYSDAHRTQQITWISSKPSVATVENGKVTAQTVGETTITATASDGTSATCVINVTTGGKLPVLEFEFDYTEEISVSLNEKLNFEGWVNFNGMEFSDAEISYESSDDTVGAVSADGVFSPLKEGTTVVTVKAQWRNIQSELLTRIFTITVI